MSETDQKEPKQKPGALRQAITLLVALGILAAAAVVIYPKLQSRTEGPVRLDIMNASGASINDPQISLRVPADQTVEDMKSVIETGRLVTIYEGMGPVEIESIGYTYGGDSLFQTHQLDHTIEPGGVVVLRITEDGVEVDAKELVPETP